MNSVTEKVVRDINDRGMAIVGFVVADKNDKIQFISYDENGNVSRMTDKMNGMEIYERIGGRMIRPQITIKKTIPPEELSKQGYHKPPQTNSYEYGFADVTICKECGRTALRDEQHPVNPCPSCGGDVYETVGKWIPPETAGWWIFKKEIIPGRWELKKDGNI